MGHIRRKKNGHIIRQSPTIGNFVGGKEKK